MTHRSDLYRLAAETLLDARTVGKVLAGERVLESTRAAVTAAARKLGIEVPPLQSSPRSGKGSNERYQARHAAKGKTHGAHARGSSSRGPARGSSSRGSSSDRSDRSARGSQAPAQSAQTAAPSTGRVSA